MSVGFHMFNHVKELQLFEKTSVSARVQLLETDLCLLSLEVTSMDIV